MKKIYKNWFIHNVFGHSLSELLYWIIVPFDAKRASIVSMWVLDATCPSKGHKDETYVNIKKLK